MASVAQAAIDAPPLVLEHLTTPDGLPQGTVFATLQDSQGFVWLGTEDGLVRYDGHELVRYAYSPSSPRGLPGNFIYQIIEDAHHDLWIAIKDAGVARWNRASDTFTVFRHDPANPDSLASDAARAVLMDARGRVWIGTSDAGVDILEPTTGHIEHLRHDPANANSLIDDRIFTLALDRSGSCGSAPRPVLTEWQSERGAFSHFRHASEDPALAQRRVRFPEYSRIRAASLWVATYDGGLDQMDRDGRVAEVFRHDPRHKTSLSNDDVRAVLEDQARSPLGRYGRRTEFARSRRPAGSSTMLMWRATPARCETHT